VKEQCITCGGDLPHLNPLKSQLTYEQKVNLWHAAKDLGRGQTRIPNPPVHTGGWEVEDWIAWVDGHGLWVLTPREAFKKLVWDRTQVDPLDEWSDMTPALTEAQAAEAKALVTAAVTAEDNGPAPSEYTCDKCDHRFVCPLLFDLYNTQGDCLLEK